MHPLGRLHAGSFEIAHPDLVWQRDDQAVLLSRAPAEGAAALLDAVVPGRAPHGVTP